MMNDIAIKLLNTDRININNQIFHLERKKELIEKFLTDFPNMSIDNAQAFLSWVHHSDYAYETILDKIGIK